MMSRCRRGWRRARRQVVRPKVSPRSRRGAPRVSAGFERIDSFSLCAPCFLEGLLALIAPGRRDGEFFSLYQLSYARVVKNGRAMVAPYNARDFQPLHASSFNPTVSTHLQPTRRVDHIVPKTSGGLFLQLAHRAHATTRLAFGLAGCAVRPLHTFYAAATLDEQSGDGSSAPMSIGAEPLAYRFVRTAHLPLQERLLKTCQKN
jgi:hypothetical protein